MILRSPVTAWLMIWMMISNTEEIITFNFDRQMSKINQNNGVILVGLQIYDYNEYDDSWMVFMMINDNTNYY